MIGYKNVTVRQYFDHLDDNWCPLETHVVKELKAHALRGWKRLQEDEDLGWVDEHGQGLTFENWEANHPKKKSPPGKEIAAIGGKGKWTNQYLNTKLNALCA